MKISRTWLQTYFEKPLPPVEELGELLTFHAFEIEGIEGDVLDVKVLPDRAAYALSHRGVALELSAILDVPLKTDPLRTELPVWDETRELVLSRDPEGKTNRAMGALVRGVAVSPSPAWLKEAIESLGQRSINNIVDATNYVTLNVGQPLHAFDAGKIAKKDSVLHIGVRQAQEGESITALTGETYTLPTGALVICEANEGTALDIAGVKGGMHSAITAETTELFVSVCNFDGPTIRKTAQTLNLFTDASLRFQNKISPELAPYGMRDVLALILDVAGGEVVGVNDLYPIPAQGSTVDVLASKINSVLGTNLSVADIANVFTRLQFAHTEADGVFTITVPFERRDLVIAEDLVEEVGRIIGYEHIESTVLPSVTPPASDSLHQTAERIKDVLREHGYTEISTQSFAHDGDIMLANPLDKSMPALRASLSENMEKALLRAVQVAPRVLGPVTSVRLFELGSVFTKHGEHQVLSLGYRALSGKTRPALLDEVVEVLKQEVEGDLVVSRTADDILEISLENVSVSETYVPTRIQLGPYHSFSVYPFALRDVAVWTPTGTEELEVVNVVLKGAGEYLARIDLFDRFEKEGRISYAFRLVFEANDRTLSDVDLDPAMERVSKMLNEQEGWEVR